MSRPPHGFRQLPPGSPDVPAAGELVGAWLLVILTIAIALAAFLVPH